MDQPEDFVFGSLLWWELVLDPLQDSHSYAAFMYVKGMNEEQNFKP